MSYAFEERNLPPQPMLYKSATCATDQIGATLMEILPEVFAHMARNEIQMAGPPFARYTDWQETTCSLEAGLTTMGRVAGEEDIQAGELQGGRVVTTTHMGPYESLPGAYEAIMTWMKENGVEMGGDPWEVYMTDPAETPDPADYRTDVFWPIK